MEDYDAKVNEAYKQRRMDGIPCTIEVVNGVRTIRITNLDKIWEQICENYIL